MKTKITTLAACCLLLAVGCSSIQTRHSYDPAVNLGALKTYAWVPDPASFRTSPPDQLPRDPDFDRLIRAAIEGELARKGLVTDAKAPDFLIAYQVAVGGTIEVSDWGYTYASRTRYYAAKGYGVTEAEKYEKGTLVIDFVDPKTREVIWRGEAQGGLDPKRTTDEGMKIARKVVARILEEFPPPSTH